MSGQQRHLWQVPPGPIGVQLCSHSPQSPASCPEFPESPAFCPRSACRPATVNNPRHQQHPGSNKATCPQADAGGPPTCSTSLSSESVTLQPLSERTLCSSVLRSVVMLDMSRSSGTMGVCSRAYSRSIWMPENCRGEAAMIHSSHQRGQNTTGKRGESTQ